MRLEIQFFLVIVIVSNFMGLVLQVVNLFMPSGNKQACLRMFNLLLSPGMKGLKTKTNWCISSKYFCSSYNDRYTCFRATMILTHLKVQSCNLKKHG